MLSTKWTKCPRRLDCAASFRSAREPCDARLCARWPAWGCCCRESQPCLKRFRHPLAVMLLACGLYQRIGGNRQPELCGQRCQKAHAPGAAAEGAHRRWACALPPPCLSINCSRRIRRCNRTSNAMTGRAVAARPLPAEANSSRLRRTRRSWTMPQLMTHQATCLRCREARMGQCRLGAQMARAEGGTRRDACSILDCAHCVALLLQRHDV